MSAYQVMLKGKQVALLQFTDGEWCLQSFRDNGTKGRIDRFEKMKEAMAETSKLGKVKLVLVKPSSQQTGVSHV